MQALDICTSLATRIGQELNETNQGTLYFSNIYNNTATKSYLANDVPSFPMVTVTPGPESFTYEPSGVRWTHQLIYIRAYVKDEYEQERLIQQLIRDLKKVLDTPERIKYTITNPDGSQEDRFVTIDKLHEVTTDEGVLRPLAIGELSLSLQYCEDGRII